MEKAFRTAPLGLLARWIFSELQRSESVLGIPKQNFQVPGPRLASRLFGRNLAAPLGVAAGPHSQLSQNIVASWLCGARFIELKTVQILDEIEVSRPCIDVADEAYNCEWSQELKLEQSFDEYLNGWVLVHALAHKLGLKEPGMLFNMSVGYNLEGIQHERVQRFIASMRDASAFLPAAIDTVAKIYPGVRDIEIPHQLSNHITLSTMHGCPPAEIERIGRHLLQDLGVETWVKLNPTLLGPERLRGLLNQTLGFAIEVPDAAFEHDPVFEDAIAMLRNLAQVAEGRGRSFGIKLSNTLEVANKRPIFPPAEKMMYLSGRALHPLTLKLAELVTNELDGAVPISFCGGADAHNFADLVADGLSPITVCTDLLKPGGFARLQQYLVNLEGAMTRVGANDLDAFVQASSGGKGARFNLANHAAAAAKDPRYARSERPLTFKGDRPLGHFDCIAAPCQDACPTHQNIPDYLWHVAHGDPSAAMDVILRTNPQPGVTGSVCDRPCIERCVRNFYDGPVAIREIKRFAFEHGEVPVEQCGPKIGVKAAIIGAGPAGLAAAYYLAKMGFDAEVFEAKTELGGMVSGVIPGYRLTHSAIEGDLERLRQLGVRFHLGKAVGRDVTFPELRAAFPYVFLSVGAQKGKRLNIPGEAAPGVMDALEFLDKVRAEEKMALGKRILIIGAGNSAMDAVRSARRLVKDAEVSLVYRRTRAEMPADAEEVHDCIKENIGLRDLLAPARVVIENGKVVGLACTRMKLGEPDASGRPRPVPVHPPGHPEGEVMLPADTIIPAIGQEPVLDFLGGLEVQRNRDNSFTVDPETCETSVPGLFAGGDVVRGAASIIKAIADGRAVALAIGRLHGLEPVPEPLLEKHVAANAMMEKKARLDLPQLVPVLPITERGGFAEVAQTFSPAAAQLEASRCLDCDDVCSLCVTVCPNRANLAYGMAPLKVKWPSLVVRDGQPVAEGSQTFAIDQAVQIINIADFCNECGNCTTFCPTSGAPYKDKPRFWIDREGFDEAKDDRFRMEQAGDRLLLEARLHGATHWLERQADVIVYRTEAWTARFQRASLDFLGVELLRPLSEGRALDLSPCATLVALLNAESVLPIEEAQPEEARP